MNRRLSAILAADVVGYSAMMAEDEAGTLESLRRLRREVFHPSVAGHRGKVVKAMGDGWLVEFASAVDAVNAAVAVQVGLERDEAIRLRVGIHLGDITHEDEDIYGDGVNIAARLEALAEPGAVVISDAVYGSLDGTLTPSFEDAGEQALKNIPRLVKTWIRRPAGSGATPAPGRMTADAGNDRDFKTLISIEPLATSDTRDEVRELAAALTSDLSRYLADGRWYRAVVSERQAPGSYRLQGALRARGDRLRLEVTLQDSSGSEVWGDKIDGDLGDVFDWQDHAGTQVALEASAVIGDLERRRLDAVEDDDMTAAMLVRRVCLFRAATLDEVQRNLQRLQTAIRKDETWALPYVLTVWMISGARRLGDGKRIGVLPDAPEAFLRQAEATVGDIDGEALLAYMNVELRVDTDPDRFRARINAVLRHAPYHQMALFAAGVVHFWFGEPELSLSHLRKLAVIEDGALAHALIAMSLIELNRADTAIAAARKAVALVPDGPYGLRALAGAYAIAGRLEEAQETIAKLLALHPDATIASLRRATPFTDNEATRRYVDALRLAGLPEGGT